MAEFDFTQTINGLTVEGEYINTLCIEGFSLMMKDPSYCYKFYWLEAIVQLISENKQETTFDEIIDEMICNAWYSVREFHIHLSGMTADGGINDGLERAVLKLAELSNLPSNASKIDIRNAIKEHNKELKSAKEQLTNNVPYRALAGFFNIKDPHVNWNGVARMTAYIRAFNETQLLLPYTLGDGSGLSKRVYFDEKWMAFIQNNTVSILGWIQYEKVKWLQNNNPEVPGLVYKLMPIDKGVRQLNHVRKLWNGVIELKGVRDVFSDKVMTVGEYDIDHFIPWTFVMNDELWNLMPTDSSVNSSKSNRLPKWDKFFNGFAENQYILYELIHEYDAMYTLYESCYKYNLHSIWASQELYRKGNSKEMFYNILQKNMQPVYDSAKRQGYEVWNR